MTWVLFGPFQCAAFFLDWRDSLFIHSFRLWLRTVTIRLQVSLSLCWRVSDCLTWFGWYRSMIKLSKRYRNTAQCAIIAKMSVRYQRSFLYCLNLLTFWHDHEKLYKFRWNVTAQQADGWINNIYIAINYIVEPFFAHKTSQVWTTTRRIEQLLPFLIEFK